MPLHLSGTARLYRLFTAPLRALPRGVANTAMGTVKGSLLAMAAAMVIGIGVLLGVTVLLSAVVTPIAGTLAFQPEAGASYGMSPSDASVAREAILGDDSNPLKCIATPNMTSQAHPIAGGGRSAPTGSTAGARTAPSGRPTGGTPAQGGGQIITDSTGALTKDMEQRIETIPRGTDFYTAYAFLITALNGGTHSFTAFDTTLRTQRITEAPTDEDGAWRLVSRFFTDAEGLHTTDALAAGIIVRLRADGAIPEGDVAPLLASALSNCQALSVAPTTAPRTAGGR